MAEEDFIGNKYNVVLDGVGYMYSTLDDESPFEYRSYMIRAVPSVKERVDDSDEPGEATLADWWGRAQHSWHEGAGQDVLDSPQSSRFAFLDSDGINIWAEGKLSLLKSVGDTLNNTDTNFQVLSDAGYLFVARGAQVRRADEPENAFTAHALGGSGNVTHITSDGTYLYASYVSSGIRRSDLDAATWGSSTALVNNHTNPDIIEWVKGRLIAGKGRELRELIPGTTAEPAAFETHESEGWLWTGITETGPAIYVSGYAGKQSQIFAIRLDNDDINAGETLGAPRLVWEAPVGEIIYSIQGYSGRAVLIGTNRGVRQAIVTALEGDISVSPLIAEINQPVHDFEVYGDFAWFTWGRKSATKSGLGRIDLGNLAYASDIMYVGDADVSSVTIHGSRPVFTTLNDSAANDRVVYEHLTTLVNGGALYTGEFRYNTFELKEAHYIDYLAELEVDPGNSPVFALALETDTTYTTITGTPSHRVDNLGNSLTGAYSSIQLASQIATRYFLKISLTRKAADVTLGDILSEWRLRAEPKPTTRLRHFVPLQIYDVLTTLDGQKHGQEGRAVELLGNLLKLYKNQTVFRAYLGWNNALTLSHNATANFPTVDLSATIEDIEFKQYAVGNARSPVGGIALVVLKEAGPYIAP